MGADLLLLHQALGEEPGNVISIIVSEARMHSNVPTRATDKLHQRPTLGTDCNEMCGRGLTSR